METTKSKKNEKEGVQDVTSMIHTPIKNSGNGVDETVTAPETGKAGDALTAASTGNLDDIEAFCVKPGSAAPAAKQVLLKILLGKPPRQDFIRVRPEADFQREIYCLKDEHSFGDEYLVAPHIVPLLGGLAVRKLAQLAVTRRGTPLIWLIKLRGDDGRLDNWNEVALAASRLAQKKWIRIAPDIENRGYDVVTVEDGWEIPEPVWPNLTMAEAMTLAFQDRIIRDVNHPIVRRILGRE
jgi:hypothetical protein